MKRIISMLIFACIAIGMSAQETQEHLKFKGIPIDGTVSNFVAKLKQKGYTYITEYNGAALLIGEFASTKDCLIFVIAPSNNGSISKIGVEFPSYDTWAPLESKYMSLKNMLSTKYGAPFYCEETFQTYSQPTDDGLKMSYLKMDKCKYNSAFDAKNGEIQLSITHFGYDSCYIKLVYFDDINDNAAQENAMDDL